MNSNDTPDIPLHHYPAVQGMHQIAVSADSDPWQSFFSACWDAFEEMQSRRAAQQSSATDIISTQQKERA